MASVDREHSREGVTAVIVEFECSRDEPVWISTDTDNWIPTQMTRHGDIHKSTVSVPAHQETLFYKFRIGDNEWVNDARAPSVPDGFGGANNRFDVPKPTVQLQSKQLEKGPAQKNIDLEQSYDKVVPEDEAYHSDDSAKTETNTSTILSDEGQPTTQTLNQHARTAKSTAPQSTGLSQSAEIDKRELEVNPALPEQELKAESIPEAIAPLQKSPASFPFFFGLAAIGVSVLALLWKTLFSSQTIRT